MKDYTDLTLPELFKLLRERSLATDGVKDSLISRLEAYDAVNDPSPSPSLHQSPIRSPVHNHQLAPAPISHHIPIEPDEDYIVWDDDEDAAAAAAAASVAFNTATVTGFGAAMEAVVDTVETTKITDIGDVTEPKSPKSVKDTPQEKPNSSFVHNDESSSQSSVHSPGTPPSLTPSLIEKVSKSGYKYKSIAATFFPDTLDSIPQPSTSIDSINCSTPSTVSTEPITMESPVPSTLSAESSKTTTKPAANLTPSATSNALSRASALPDSSNSPATTSSVIPGSFTKEASPTAITACKASIVSVPTSHGNITTGTTVISEENAYIKPTISTGRLRTTQTGFQFKSISALFPSPVVALARAPATPMKLQATANVADSTTSTYPTDVKLTAKQEEAKRFAMRAARFGATSKEPENYFSAKGSHGRFGQTDAHGNYVKENERNSEIEKERERERIRQRVTNPKRQRNDNDDDRQTEGYYKRNRHPHYYSSGSKPSYNSRRRY